METDKKRIGFTALVVAVAVVVLALFMHESPVQAPTDHSTKPVGLTQSDIGKFPEGAQEGDQVVFDKVLSIGSGANQTAWKNTLGRTVYIDASSVKIGYVAGTATSSLNYYVGTSTSATQTDYARPTRLYMPIDGATFATSTSASMINGTSTSNGVGSVAVQDGEYLFFMVSEKFGCKTNASCETATSTNRGITAFFAKFTGRYQP